MIHEIINLELDYNKIGRDKSEYKSTLHAFIPNESQKMSAYTSSRPSILIFPGGGYSYVSEREAEPIAVYFMSKGFNCFILYYSAGSATYPVQLLEAAKAMQTIRENAGKWLVDTDKIFLCGFSAGGHLAANLGLFYDKSFVSEALCVDGKMLKPKGMLLCYPVLAEESHLSSYKNLLGDNHSDEEAEKLNLINHVSKNTPPCFIWHTYEDKTVIIDTTLKFAMALRKNDIPFELHIYEHCKHGMSLGTNVMCQNPNRLSNWAEMAVDWINEHCTQLID